MLNIKYDPKRKVEEGQYFIELVDFDPTDSSHINRFGYWCDIGHLESAILGPIIFSIPKELFSVIIEKLIK